MSKDHISPPKDRESLGFPYLKDSLKRRLKKSGAINMRDNYTADKKGCYWEIKPIDKGKKI